MFVINRSQIEAFREPMREVAQDKLVAAMRQDGLDVTVAPDKSAVVLADEDGNKTTLTYGNDKLPATITKPSGATYKMGHDAEGRLSRFTFPDGNQLRLQFAEGQLRQLGASPEKNYRFSYQKGQLTEVTYPGEKRQRFIYDDFGGLTASIDRTGQVREFTRTPDGQLHAITDPLNRKIRFGYDEQGLLSQLIFPDQTTQTYQYDEDEDALYMQLRDGNGFRQQFAGELITQLAWEDGPIAEFSYNPDGQPVLIIANDNRVSFDYDDKNRLITEEGPVGAVSFEYAQANGPLTGLLLPTGLAIGYDYDTENRVTALHVADETIRYVYNDKQDLLAEIQYPNGLTQHQRQSHTEGLQQAQVQTATGQILSEQRYEYDSWDRLARYQDTTIQQDHTLTYDDECRLTGVVESRTAQALERYAYDAKGNLDVHNNRRVYVGPMDEIRQIGTNLVQYDGLGNIHRLNGPRGELQCFFARNSTLQTVRVGAETWQYGYDGIGRRVSKTNGVQSWRFGWAGSQLVVEEFQSQPGTTPVVREYIYLPDSQVRVAFRERGRLYCMQADVRGAITRVFDDRGQLVWHGGYSAFGEMQLYRDQVRQPWRLMGQYEDAETGLYYNLARYYCPWLTTYLSLDPEWLDSETLHYGYARNDPYNRTDPFGNIAPLLVAVGIGALVGGIVGGVVKAVEGGSWRQIAGAAAHGALSGAGAALGGIVGFAAGGPLGAYAGMVAGTGVGGFLGSMAQRAINGEPVLTVCALKGAAMDALGEMAWAAALPIVGKLLGPVLGPIGRRLAGTRLGQTITNKWKYIVQKLLPKPFKAILGVRAKVLNKKDHIFKVEMKPKADGTYKFSGVHHKDAIDNLGVGNGRIEITTPPNAGGVYEAKVFAKGPDGLEYTKSGNGGKSTFFPDTWNEPKVLEEVEYAITNNKGYIDPANPQKGYFGYSKDGKVKIGFYYNDATDTVNSFFPIL